VGLVTSVLVLGAHPDDELGCVGTISRMVREGASVKLITFSECLDLNGPELLSEWKVANSAFGVETHLLDFPNRSLPDYRQEILDRLDEERGKHSLVLCPSTMDVHQDHSTVAMEARRIFKDTTVLGYELPLNQVAGNSNRCYVTLTQEDVDAKIAHANFYQSQQGEAYMSADYLASLARVRGVQAETEFAEAFEVIRWVI
jgi:LmbE family N-acetylglucosaminyl deacetylase